MSSAEWGHLLAGKNSGTIVQVVVPDLVLVKVINDLKKDRIRPSTPNCGVKCNKLNI